ncbi:hypothetical protein [Rhodococcoides fascians]|uniref:hypothetical protein n=1 Tax=Rhodococcoides fascians TaxID=1828 RepID=UPI00068D4864|nr:hypothetical protein [Rhodococcus fascians]
MATNSTLQSIGGAALIAFHLIAAKPLRRWRTTWGASISEIGEVLPGDDSVPTPSWTYTHAVTVDCSARQLWPWLVQIGQQRAGFYSYRTLENMVGCHITHAEGIDPAFQHLDVGDLVALHPKSPPLTVTIIEHETTLVLVGPGPTPQDSALWSFHLRPAADGGTRLIERGRYAHGGSLASRLTFGYSLVEPIGFVMSRKMLRTLRSNAAARPERGEPTRRRPEALGFE